jgi:hypothetical protein
MQVFVSTYGWNGGIGIASSPRNGAIRAQPTITAATAPRETAGKVARRTHGKNRMLIISSGLHRESLKSVSDRVRTILPHFVSRLSSADGDVRFWHKTDMAIALNGVRFWG